MCVDCWHVSKNEYHKWCKANGFTLMLPEDVKACKTAAAVVNTTQGTLDDHAKEIKLGDRVIYSDKCSHEATVEWLITTNQVCLLTLHDLLLMNVLANPGY